MVARPAEEEASYREMQREADRICSLIIGGDYPAIDVVIEIRKLRAFSAALCVAICISTVATGWHYVVDVFAGIAVAAVSQMIASWALRTQPLAVHPALCLDPAFTPFIPDKQAEAHRPEAHALAVATDSDR